MKTNINGEHVFVYQGKAESDVIFVSENPSIIFIHGAQQDHSCWTLQSRWFAHHGFNTFVPDLPGHGMSGGRALSSVGEMAKWIIDLVHQLKLDRVHLVGHSMGSLVALEAALQYQERIRKIILIGTSLPMPVSDVLLDAAQNSEGKAIAMVNNFSHSSQGQLGRNSVPGMWMLGTNQRLMERQEKGVFLSDLSACNQYIPDENQIKSLTIPVLIIAGLEDKMTSAKSAMNLAQQISGAKLCQIKGAGHALMAESPDKVLDCLIDFTA